MRTKNYRVRTLPVSKHDQYNLSEYPNFHRTGSITGMKRLYYGKTALLVRCGSFIYNVTSNPDIYNAAY